MSRVEMQPGEAGESGGRASAWGGREDCQEFQEQGEGEGDKKREKTDDKAVR